MIPNNLNSRLGYNDKITKNKKQVCTSLVEMQPSWAYPHSTHEQYFYLCLVKSQAVGRTDTCLFTMHMKAVRVLLATGQSPE